MRADKIKVTPETASQWLLENDNYRVLNEERVAKYAKDMSSGSWKRNGATIVFDGRNNLIDGQHRLSACIRSGEPFETIVVRGVDADADETIDMGQPRNLKQICKKREYPYPDRLPSVAKLVLQHNMGFWDKATTSQRNISLMMALNFIDSNVDDLVAAVRMADKAAAVVRQSSPLSAIFFIGGLNEGGEWFSARLKDGLHLGETDPVLHLRNKLIEIHSPKHISNQSARPIITRAWNLYCKGVPCYHQSLRFSGKNGKVDNEILQWR